MLWETVIILDFMRRGENDRGKCTNNPAGHYPIWTIDASTSITPPHFTPDALPAATFPIYSGLGQAPNMLECLPGVLVDIRL